jgi:hypothetical protein
MRKLIAFAPLPALLLLAPPVWAWGKNGHKTVGQIAELHLQGTNVLARLVERKAMRPGDTLANMANWADAMRDRPLSSTVKDPDPDTQDFLRRVKQNKSHAEWHFVNLPLGCASYGACAAPPTVFTRKDDIVQLIKECVARLRAPAGAQHRLTKRNALRMLIHLVGDLHQPLHVGSGFVNLDGPDDTIVIVREPAAVKAGGFASDRGATLLLLDGHSDRKLHGLWDGDLVEELRGDRKIKDLAAALKGATATPDWDVSQPPDKWVEEWASQSLRVSGAHAYASVRITREVTQHEPDGGDKSLGYAIRTASDYNAKNQKVAGEQLAKGGFRLASLLAAIVK